MKKLILLGMLFAHGIVFSMDRQQCLEIDGDVPASIIAMLSDVMRSVHLAVPIAVMPCMCAQSPSFAVVDVRKREDFSENMLQVTGLGKQSEKYGCIVLFHPFLSQLRVDRQQLLMQQAAREICLGLRDAINADAQSAAKKEA